MLKAVAIQALRAGLACVVGAAYVLAPAPAAARGPLPHEGFPTITLAELPPQGRTTYARIRAGGPFPYEKDGTVFGNRERLLPQQRRGYWREYTVRTPGVRHRGARRIVCGGVLPSTPEVCYYSADHYASFRVITP